MSKRTLQKQIISHWESGYQVNKAEFILISQWFQFVIRLLSLLRSRTSVLTRETVESSGDQPCQEPWHKYSFFSTTNSRYGYLKLHTENKLLCTISLNHDHQVLSMGVYREFGDGAKWDSQPRRCLSALWNLHCFCFPGWGHTQSRWCFMSN